MTNKKGFITSGLATILLYFGFVLLIIIFYFLLKLTIGETDVPISGHIGDSDANFVVLNYLRMPVKYKIDDKDISTDMSGLIIRYYLEQGTSNEGKFQDLIREKTKEVFDEKYPHLKWKIKVSDKRFNNAKAVASDQTTSKLTKDDTLVKGFSIVCVTLPNPEMNKLIKVEVDLLNLNADASEREKYEGLKNIEFKC